MTPVAPLTQQGPVAIMSPTGTEGSGGTPVAVTVTGPSGGPAAAVPWVPIAIATAIVVALVANR
jgi:hypothetical protein